MVYLQLMESDSKLHGEDASTDDNESLHATINQRKYLVYDRSTSDTRGVSGEPPYCGTLTQEHSPQGFGLRSWEMPEGALSDSLFRSHTLIHLAITAARPHSTVTLSQSVNRSLRHIQPSSLPACLSPARSHS